MNKSMFPDLPSHIHTARELELMLSGCKLLAMFSDAVQCLPNEEIIPDKQFQPYVSSGEIIRCEFEFLSKNKALDGKNYVIKNVLFALKGEEWRIETMKLLRTEQNRTGKWNETCERMEGKLLGYTNKENDQWIRWQRDNQSKI